MNLVGGSDSLRSELNRITSEVPLDSQRTAVASISEPHSVSLMVNSGDATRGNCFAHALGLTEAVNDDEILRALAQRDPWSAFGRDIHPDSCFVRWVWINGYFVEGEGPLVLYFANERPVHAAARTEELNMVVSKWGGGHMATPGRRGASVLRNPCGHGAIEHEAFTHRTVSRVR